MPVPQALSGASFSSKWQGVVVASRVDLDIHDHHLSDFDGKAHRISIQSVTIRRLLLIVKVAQRGVQSSLQSSLIKLVLVLLV